MATLDPATVLTTSLLSTDGTATTLQQQLGAGALVVVFLRHFG